MLNLLILLDQVTKKTPSEAVEAIFKGLGEAMLMVKKGFYALAPEIMVGLGEFWIFLIPFAMYFIFRAFHSIKEMAQGL